MVSEELLDLIARKTAVNLVLMMDRVRPSKGGFPLTAVDRKRWMRMKKEIDKEIEEWMDRRS